MRDIPDTDTPPLPAPPDDEGGLLDWVRLARSPRVGATTFRRLLAEHGTATAALDALPRVAADAGVRGYAPCSRDIAAAELSQGRAAAARPVPLGARDYPDLLARIADPPPFLWVRGRLAEPTRMRVGMVGARNASALGMRMAAHLARGLGALGLVTVSGLARGIDTAVHEASVDSGTIAVLAGGIDIIYPSENAALAARITESGALVTEMPPGLSPQARHFPRRNRIVSGLCPGIVVIEGAAKSGSLITARTALDQGREVMAVPGHPFDARAAGCLMLLRDGATLVRSARDVAEALGAAGTEAPAAAPEDRARGPKGTLPGGIAPALLNLLGPAPISEDALIRQIAAPPAEILAALAELELTGALTRHAGGLVSRLDAE
ncbi:DNA-protecting protein DprA [Halovulum dunhuangense]|uniref:DNA-protecting protein DprA n=1 Tax=Halovulum dunhuangense TaxID=1505036 RepID=A0A849L0D9_9RHOB|nr:DNA-processing protein DprA [Halovulum dunhuangense]NNU79721.1 DNA-protecting protein DprA [Halovulum dunhuangense]